MSFFRHRYPYTNFHELNLDYILDKVNNFADEMKNYVRYVVGTSSGIIKVIDGDGNEGEIGFIKDSDNANHALTADSATTALSANISASAEKANKDKNNKNLTSYIASAEVQNNNTVVLYDGENEVVETLTITSTPANSVITIKENEYSTASLFTMNVGEYDYFDSDFTLRQIQTLLTQGVAVVLRKKETEMLDADFTSFIYSSVGGIFFNLLAFNGSGYTWRSFKIETDTTHEYSVGIKYQIKRVM